MSGCVDRWLVAGVAVLAALCGGLLMFEAGTSLGAEPGTETREFAVLIDRKAAGSYRMTISRQSDGSTIMSGQADVRLRYVVYTYMYTYRGDEVWKEGRLVQLSSSANDDGKRYTVSAASENRGVRVLVNGKEQGPLRSADVWTTTYWHLPSVRSRNQAIELLDADTGNAMSATLQHVGVDQLPVGGQMQNCAHYQLRSSVNNKVHVDAWYDGQERLVRQESMEDGHHYTLELIRIRP